VASLPPGFKEDFYSGGDVQIHYVEGPRNGAPLVLLHGTARDWNSFSVLLPQLSSRFHVFIPDLRGHGRSGRAPGEYRVAQFAADISGFVHNVVPSAPAIFGHSLGGIVALTVAADYPLSAVIVGDSMLSPENLAAGIYHLLFQHLREVLILGGSQDQIARGMGKIQLQLPGIDEPVAIADLPGNTEPILREWARSAMCTDPDVLRMAVDGSTYKNWTAKEVLPRVPCPVLLLQGNPELDALLTDSDVALAKQLLRRVEHIKFPLLGHALFMQRPEPVLKAMFSFLEPIQAGSPALPR
jgi:pimeloyl-ACP methyl ester carboxylesterase